jgi:hypothetical protein
MAKKCMVFSIFVKCSQNIQHSLKFIHAAWFFFLWYKDSMSIGDIQ